MTSFSSVPLARKHLIPAFLSAFMNSTDPLTARSAGERQPLSSPFFLSAIRVSSLRRYSFLYSPGSTCSPPRRTTVSLSAMHWNIVCLPVSRSTNSVTSSHIPTLFSFVPRASMTSQKYGIITFCQPSRIRLIVPSKSNSAHLKPLPLYSFIVSIEKLIPVPLSFIFYCASASISSGDAVPVTPIFLTVTPDANPAN